MTSYYSLFVIVCDSMGLNLKYPPLKKPCFTALACLILSGFVSIVWAQSSRVLSTEHPPLTQMQWSQAFDASEITGLEFKYPDAHLKLIKAEDQHIRVRVWAETYGEARLADTIHSELIKPSDTESILSLKLLGQAQALPGFNDHLEIELALPAALKLSIQSKAGEIRMERPLNNAITIRSESANVYLQTVDDADVWSRSGHIHLVNLSPDQKLSLHRMSSHSGDIELILTTLAESRVEIETAGTLLLESRRLAQSMLDLGHKRVIQTGESHHLYEIETDTGSVRVGYQPGLLPPD